MDAPVFGAEGTPYPDAGRWQASLSWRYQKSFRHFVSSEEQVEREIEESQVINRIHIADVSIGYAVNERVMLSVGIPFVFATRSSPIRDDNGDVIDRYTTQARALGDIMVTAKRWMIAPSTSPDRNVSLGLGVKLPTGADNIVDTRSAYDDGEITTRIQTVDQSIQPGDGGFGLLGEIAVFHRFAGRRAAMYASGSYLSNPGGTNGVETYRSRPSEAKMSIADQYIVRAGLGVAVPGVGGLGASAGVRYEGVPAEDLIGPSDGFRRPGRILSIEPGLNYPLGGSTVSVAVPVALYRERVRSVPDVEDGRHGDAAFADYLILVGVSRRL
jgi:hypothetical protein